MKDAFNRSKATLFLLSLAAVLASACSGGSASANETEDESFFSRAASTFFEKTYEVPEGTRIKVRLNHSVSTTASQSGSVFESTLDRDLRVQDVLLAPAGSRVEGRLTHVKDSSRVKGRAEMTMTLNRIWLNETDYSLQTNPLTFRARSTAGKDAAVIGGSSAVGAVVGALTDGKKGAAIGAGIGAGAGTGFVLVTKGKEIELSPEAPLEFVLSEAVELPAYEEK